MNGGIVVPAFHLQWFLLGAGGGLLPDAIRFAKNRQGGFPAWFRKLGYWIGLLVLVGLGGVAAWLGGATEWKSALAMGFTAPEVISRMLGTDKPTVRGRSVGGFDIRRWWSR
jgi:hypothetical protein